MVTDSRVMPGDERTVVALEDEQQISAADLLEQVKAWQAANARFVTATCLDLGGKLEVLYHFDQELRLRTLRVTVEKDEDLASISGVYLCAFLVENEMKELFGLLVKDIAVDYQGRLLLSEGGPIAPMLKSPPTARETN